VFPCASYRLILALVRMSCAAMVAMRVLQQMHVHQILEAI